MKMRYKTGLWRHIATVLLLLLTALPSFAARAQRLSSTEGSEFWVAFLNNYQALATDASLDLEIIVTASQPVTVKVDAADGSHIGQLQIASAGGWDTLKIDPTFTQLVYPELMTGLPTGSGIHVYSTDTVTTFTCYAYSRMGLTGSSSRDAALVLPLAALGTEYIVQTFRDETMSSEFAIVATEDNTAVYITPSNSTKSAMPASPIMMSRGQVFFVESTTASEESPDVDLSGSLICADRPIAVFTGNEGAAIPERVEGNAGDHAYEQVMPIDKLGTEFYIGLAKNTSVNAFYVTAAYDNTQVTLSYYDLAYQTDANVTVTLNRGQSLLETSDPTYPTVYRVDNDAWMTNVKITASNPVLVYDYLSMPSANQAMEGRVRYQWGDGANAMVPAWSHRLTHASFYTKQMDPQYAQKSIQRHFVHFVTKTADIGTFTLTNSNGTTTPIAASDFTAFTADPTMSYASIEVPSSGGHTLTTTGQGFVGYVYGVGEGLSYQYTLTFNPMPGLDSLFVTTTDPTMTPSYELSRKDQGWYQRQKEEYSDPTQAHWDTVRVCDSTTVPFALDLGKFADTVHWSIYRYDNAGNRETTPLTHTTEQSKPVGLHNWSYYFTLEDQESLIPPQRDPFTLYELEIVTVRKHLICQDLTPEYDTLHTLVQVTRLYSDTIKRVICMGDTAYFYFDHHDGSSYIVPHDKTTRLDSTGFISGATASTYREGYVGGYNYYARTYQTLYGCDSLVAFELYVCDTFRTVIDTSFCENRLSDLYITDKLSGNYFAPVDKVYFDTLKTRGCDYRDIDAMFRGCDSIIELHLHVAPTPVSTKYRTWCSTDTTEIFYEWIVGPNWMRGGLEDTIRISSKDPRFVETGSSTNKKKVGIFADTMMTHTCPECPGGGCDSILRLQLTIPMNISRNYYESMCDSMYDQSAHTLFKNETYRWRATGNKRLDQTKRLWNNTTGTYVRADSLTYLPPTANGRPYQIIDSVPGQQRWDEEQQDYVMDCDTTYILNLTVKPTRLVEQTITIPDNVTYTWTRTAAGITHSDVVGPFSAEGSPYLFVDSITTCSSIYECSCYDYFHLHVIIASNYYYEEEASMCDNVPWTWATHKCGHTADTTFSGLAPGTYVIWDSLRTKGQPMETDSVYRLTLTVNPTYRYDDTIRICDTDLARWQGLLIAGIKADAGSETPDRIYAHGLHYDTARYTTVFGCDSIYYLAIYVHESFYPTEDSTICQDGDFTWTGHEGHSLTDPAGNPVVISTAEAGTFVYIDHLYTSDCPTCSDTRPGCDSVFRLNLTVRPSYIGTRTLVTEDTICQSSVPYIWTGHKDEHGQDRRFSVSGTYYDSLTTTLGCDSVMELRLIVIPNTTQYLDTLLCQNDDPFYYGAQRHYISPADSVPGTRTISKVVGIAAGCSYEEILTFTIYPSFYHHQYDTVCQDLIAPTYTWTDSTGATHDAVTISIARTGDYIYRDNLTTVNGCDSIWTLHLHVDTVYRFDESITMCSNETITWQKRTFNGHTSGTFAYDTTWVSQQLCDSSYYLTLTVLPAYPAAVDTTYFNICDDETFTFYETTYNTNGEWVSPTHAEQRYAFTRLDTTIHGCDSMVAHVVYVHPTYFFPQTDTICQDTVNTSYIWTDLNGHTRAKTASRAYAGTYILYDSILTHSGCDSVYELALTILPSYYSYYEVQMSNEDTLRWQGVLYGGSTTTLPHDVRILGGDTTIITHYPTVGEGTHTCDSTLELYLRQGKIYRDTVEGYTCSNEPYTWYRKDLQGNDSVVQTGLNEEKIYIDRHVTSMGYDSLFFLVLHFYPTYLGAPERTTRDSICQGYAYDWVDHKIIPAGLSVGEYVFYDSLKTVAHSCDSVWTLHLRVDSVYDYTDRITICSNDTLDWQGFRIYDLSAGDYTYDTIRKSIHNCDSTYHLLLHVNPAYLEAQDTTYHSICDNDTLVFYGTTYNRSGEWVSPAHEVQRVELSYMDTTIRGCDSLAVHVVYVHPTYLYHTPDTATCRYVPFVWEGHENRNLFLVETGQWTDSIAVSQTGTFHYIDSLKTLTCPLCHEGGGCDSVWTLTLTVHPVGRSDSSYVVCSNDVITWQRRLFVGHDYDTVRWGVPAPQTAAYDSVIYLPDTLHYADTARYLNEFGCDVIFYLELRIDTMAYTRIHESICDNDSTWTFGHDRWYHTSAEYYPANYQDYRADRQVVLLDSLYSLVTGCDSIVELTLDIYPSYRFDTTITTCSNVITPWRNFPTVNYWPTGTYYDTVKTAHGCDSVFVLHLNTVPSFYSRQTKNICKNDTIEWQLQRIYYQPENEGDVFTTYTVYYSTGEACDSTYIMDVYYYDWYTMRDTDVICGNQPYYWRGRTITEPGTYYDSLKTRKCGCDSIFIITLYHHPVYLFERYDSICRNEQFNVGDYVIDDTLYTIYGCDSIYRQYLHVSPDYAFDTVFSFRDDEVYVWQNQRYQGYQIGGTYSVGEYYDTVHYTSHYGCDSVYRARFMVYYEHYDTTRVFCTGEETTWHGRTYSSLYATTIYDTIRTYTSWGNDSTFYFRVRFNQSYYFPETASVCVDDGYENWHGHNIDSLIARVWEMTNDTVVTYWDSCFSVHGCDSVYSLTIQVRPITYSEIWDTLCIGDAYPFHSRYLTEEGIYVDTGLNIYGCKHIETLYLTKIDPREYAIEVTEVCADGGGYTIAVTCGVRRPKTYSIIYDENDQLDNIISKVYDDSLILVPIPLPETRQQYVRPDWYHAKLYLEGVCVDNEIVAQRYDLLVRYPSWIIEQHWNDAIGILVPELNGGYTFSAYQWYQNGEVLVGETDSYLFQPHYLENGGWYYVALTREGEDYAIPTCPIQASIGPDDPLMPTTPYISVVPTIVEKENPVVYILSPNQGDYYIYDPHGTLYKSGSFIPDDHAAADLRVPAVPGMYIIRLKDVTGLRRDVKILVK